MAKKQAVYRMLILVKKLMVLNCIFYTGISFASIDKYRSLIESHAREKGVPIPIISSIIRKESGGQPWSMNIDGESFRFKSKNDAIHAIKKLKSNHPLVRRNDLKELLKQLHRRTYRKTT